MSWALTSLRTLSSFETSGLLVNWFFFGTGAWPSVGLLSTIISKSLYVLVECDSHVQSAVFCWNWPQGFSSSYPFPCCLCLYQHRLDTLSNDRLAASHKHWGLNLTNCLSFPGGGGVGKAATTEGVGTEGVGTEGVEDEPGVWLSDSASILTMARGCS